MLDRYITETPGLFDALTATELAALMDAIVSRRGDGPDYTLGYSSNRMSGLLGGSDLGWTYSDIASEIGHLHAEIGAASRAASERELAAWIAEHNTAAVQA